MLILSVTLNSITSINQTLPIARGIQAELTNIVEYKRLCNNVLFSDVSVLLLNTLKSIRNYRYILVKFK